MSPSQHDGPVFLLCQQAPPHIRQRPLAVSSVFSLNKNKPFQKRKVCTFFSPRGRLLIVWREIDFSSLCSIHQERKRKEKVCSRQKEKTREFVLLLAFSRRRRQQSCGRCQMPSRLSLLVFGRKICGGTRRCTHKKHRPGKGTRAVTPPGTMGPMVLRKRQKKCSRGPEKRTTAAAATAALPPCLEADLVRGKKKLLRPWPRVMK